MDQTGGSFQKLGVPVVKGNQPLNSIFCQTMSKPSTSNLIASEKRRNSHDIDRQQVMKNPIVVKPRTDRTSNPYGLFNKQEIIQQEVVRNICQKLMEKDPRINKDFLLKVAISETQAALNNQKLISSKNLSDLESRIYAILTKEVNVLKSKSIVVNNHNSYLTNSHQKARTYNISRVSANISPKNEIASHHDLQQEMAHSQQIRTKPLQLTTYQKSFMSSTRDNVFQANPQTTSLWFKDFEYHQQLKSLIKQQTQEDMSSFLKYQMNANTKQLELQLNKDQQYMQTLKQNNRMLVTKESIEEQMKKRQVRQAGNAVKEQHKLRMQSLRHQRHMDLANDNQFINQNLKGIANDHLKNLMVKKEKQQNGEFLKNQIQTQNQLLNSQRQNELEMDQIFIEQIGYKTYQAKRAHTTSKGTFFDHFHNRQPHKCWELQKKAEARAEVIKTKLEIEQEQKRNKEMQILDKNEQEKQMKEHMRISQERALRQQIMSDIVGVQNRQMREQTQKLIKIKEQDEELQKGQEKEAVKYEVEEWKKVEEKRKKERENALKVQRQIPEQTRIRMNEAVM